MRDSRGRTESQTFARFVVLPENRFALAAVQRLAGNLVSPRYRRLISPLFLHGPSGTGKSHLVAALIEDFCRKAPGSTVRLLSAADLGAEAVSENQLAALDVEPDPDLLVVDDLHRLPHRTAGL